MSRGCIAFRSTGLDFVREDVEHIHRFVTKYVPNAKLIEQRGSELVFVLPPNMRTKYEGLLTSLESESPRLGIRSYGMSDTTLEEIFLKVRPALSFQLKQLLKFVRPFSFTQKILLHFVQVNSVRFLKFSYTIYFSMI